MSDTPDLGDRTPEEHLRAARAHVEAARDALDDDLVPEARVRQLRDDAEIVGLAAARESRGAES